MASINKNQQVKKSLTEEQVKALKDANILLQVSVNKRDENGKLVGKKTPDGNYLDFELCVGPYNDCDVIIITQLEGDLDKSIRGLGTVMTSMIARAIEK